MGENENTNDNKSPETNHSKSIDAIASKLSDSAKNEAQDDNSVECPKRKMEDDSNSHALSYRRRSFGLPGDTSTSSQAQYNCSEEVRKSLKTTAMASNEIRPLLSPCSGEEICMNMRF